MKRSFHITAFILLLSVCRAQNNVRLFNPGGELFTVRSEGKLVHAQPQAEVLIERIERDTLRLQLEPEGRSAAEIILYLTDKGKRTNGKEFDFLVDFSRKPSRLLFAGLYDMLVLPDPLVPKRPVEDTSHRIRNNVYGHFCELKDGRPLFFDNIPASRQCREPMPEKYVNYAELVMLIAETQEARYSVAENICRNNCISVDQLKVLLNYLSYEIEKLKLVKTAYHSLVDTSGREQLNSEFRFASSVQELNRFFNQVTDYRSQAGSPCSQPLDTTGVAALIGLLRSQENDSQRYAAFKREYAKYCYSPEQAHDLLMLFIHDREKLEAAKHLYFRCLEKNRFESVTPVFSYNETMSELRDFIRKQAGK